MGISPLPPGFKPGQRYGANPTRDLGPGDYLFDLFGNYQPNGHTGDDYPAPAGTPVYATADGVVMWAGPGTSLPGGVTADDWAARWYLDREHVGNLAAIEHDGYTTLSYHLQGLAPGLKPFDRVKAGQLIGYVGATGRTTGAHLHLDVITHDYAWGNGMWGRVNPAPYTSEEKGSDMIFLTDLADQLRKRGLTVVEVPGWKTRGYAGYGLYGVKGVLHHHTATSRLAFASSNMPTLNVLVNGHAGLAGPLCNLGFGRDGTVYVVAAGWANHAGPGAAPGVPRDQGNGWLIGIEAESSGVPPFDWTPDMLRVWPYLGAALESAYLAALSPYERLQLGHREYSSMGKIDPAGVNLDELRSSINRVLDEKSPVIKPQSGGTTVVKEWSEMATEKQIEDAAARGALRALNEMTSRAGGAGGKTSVMHETRYKTANDRKVQDSLARIEKLLQGIAAAVTPRRLALSVWGYKGGSARTTDDGRALDAYATLNGVHRVLHTDNSPTPPAVAGGSTESEASK